MQGLPRPFRLIGTTLQWVGLSGLLSGFAGSAVAVVSVVQNETGWGLASREGFVTREANVAALALLLGCMFFVLAGAGLVLIARPLIERKGRGPIRWPRWLSHALFVYSACCFALAVILVRDGSARSTAILIGMVVYCALVGIGLLVACWGMRRFADAG